MTDGNPFETASELVGDLRAEYKQLNKDVPKLRETKKVIVGQLDTLNRQVVASQKALDDLKIAAKLRVTAYNNWQERELDKLRKLKLDFATYKDQTIKKHEARAAELDQRERAIKTDRDKVDADLADVVTQRDANTVQHKANQNWAKDLQAKEDALNISLTTNNDREGKLDAKAAELDQREKKVLESEKAATKATDAAESDRKAAAGLLADAKEEIATNDARTDALDQLKRQLDDRSDRLDTREAGLNNRRDIMIGNGTLKTS